MKSLKNLGFPGLSEINSIPPDPHSMEFVASSIAGATDDSKPLWFVIMQSGRCIASGSGGRIDYYMSMNHMNQECGSSLDEYEPILFPSFF